MNRARIVAAAAVAALLGTLPAQSRERSNLQLMFQAGMRGAQDKTVKELLEAGPRLLEFAQEKRRNVSAELCAVMNALDAKNLPATFRLYVPDGFDKRGEPPFHLTVVDTAGRIDIDSIVGERLGASPGGPGGSGLFLREHPTPAGRRYLIGKGLDELEAELPSFADEGALPVPANRRRFLRQVMESPFYAFVDAATVAPPRALAKMRAAGGPLGSLFALSVDRTAGAWNLDFHWGGRPRQGLLGQLMPARAPRTSRLHELLPAKPGLAIQLNLGRDAARRIRSIRFPFHGKAAQSLQKVLDAGLAGWEGEIALFQPEPSTDWQPETWMPLVLTASPEFCLLARMDAEHAEPFLQALEENLSPGRTTRDPDTGFIRVDERQRSTYIGHRNGIVAVCGAPDADRASRLLRELLNATENRPAKILAPVDPALRAPAQLWVTPEAGKLLARRLRAEMETRRARTRAFAPGYLLGRRFGRELVRAGYGMSLTWDSTGMRLRVRF